MPSCNGVTPDHLLGRRMCASAGYRNRETSWAILLCLGICPCRQPHRKDRALAWLARHRDVAAHHAGELARDSQAKTGSTVLPRS